jgi:hypothetical protein
MRRRRLFRARVFLGGRYQIVLVDDQGVIWIDEQHNILVGGNDV